MDVMLEETTKAIDGGRFPHLKYLNLGGGLGIDYRKDVSERRALSQAYHLKLCNAPLKTLLNIKLSVFYIIVYFAGNQSKCTFLIFMIGHFFCIFYQMMVISRPISKYVCIYFDIFKRTLFFGPHWK